MTTNFDGPYRYTGEWYDSYIKLTYYGARWYDPTIGRFVSPDIIVPDFQNPQDLNRYSYVINNPLKFVDPDGHCRGLAGAAYNVCAQVVTALAPAVHQANEYRGDIFFPDGNTTFGDRLEASTVVGGGSTLIAAAAIEATAGTLMTAATTGGATTVQQAELLQLQLAGMETVRMRLGPAETYCKKRK